MSEDVKVEKVFYEACFKDIKMHNCMSTETTVNGEAARSRILLCLENAMKKGIHLIQLYSMIFFVCFYFV